MKKMILMTTLALCAGASQAAPLQKCVDDKGRVYYGDAIPPEVLEKCRTSSEISSKGLEKKQTRYLTDEEKQSRADATAAKKAEEQKVEEQKRRDRALLDTYTGENEILRARERNLQAAQAQIDSTKTRLKSAQERLANLHKQVDHFKRNNKPVPPDVANAVKRTEEDIRKTNETLSKWNEEYKGIETRFAEDRKRFLELKGGTPAQSSAPAK